MSSTSDSLFYQITHGADGPQLRLGSKTIPILGQTNTLSFDTSIRYCTGWHDLQTGENHPCPDEATIDARYSTCPACQKRTGFNPAFYHATSVSPQQEQRNAEPHMLYLAYMGPGYFKVGISWAKRGNKRLLDQGALAYVSLGIFPTALIARQYEAKLASNPYFHETTITKKKLQLLPGALSDADALTSLEAAKQQAEHIASTTFSDDTPVSLIEHYFYSKDDIASVKNLHELEQPVTSGTHIGLVGDILLTRHDDRILALVLKKFYGYKLHIDSSVQPLALPPTQLGLF